MGRLSCSYGKLWPSCLHQKPSHSLYVLLWNPRMSSEVFLFQFFWCKSYIYFLRLQPASGPDMEPSTCPESISEPPRIHIWQSHVGLPKLAMSRRYYKIFLPNYFRKSRPPIGPLEFCPRAKSYFRWSSTYQLFQKKFGLETVCFLIFRFQDNKKLWTSENNKKHFFSF